ncbi:EscE/YscE/SsaE family type III secretion system needle protein co-chaperone [Chromobacterium sp. ATCC 53434]|uniref:EscE/YscE/SsaE family type III secretion system needle protein co-chaperone n=1 Tax=Chromobacterium TaxID=535 RepID=UPI000C75E20F|nr:EscE/YscE/SsaE family type III secretion system needle protein co-chaperone [Chromobacterium sp. ATCC 53434]AUH50651.1 EscE/YscE/SsaE family type III secretion system needle protein co-chaperone [Chromobacterium sp. ATCC 53434]
MARITHLEDALRRDAHGAVRDALLARLEAGEVQLQRQLRQPNSQQRQQELALLQAACAQAGRVIAILWRRYHP